MNAAEAQGRGLVAAVVEPAQIEDHLAELARVIASNAPLTIRAAKAAIREAAKSEETENPAALEKWIDACFDSEEYLEGQCAFLERRTPNFSGR